MEESIRSLPSRTNRVSEGIWQGTPCVTKVYREKLKTYEANWPISRAEVEASLLLLLEKETAVHVPKLYEFRAPDTVIMEFCQGETIYEIASRMSEPYPRMIGGQNETGSRVSETDCRMSGSCSRTEETHIPRPDIAAWEKMFRFLSSLSEYSRELLDRSTKGAFVHQEEIARGMYHWKMKNRIDPPYPERRCLSLGDVSVHNLLWDGQRMTILDLECAHWGYFGYDIGQILGMAQAQLYDREMVRQMEQAYEQVVTDLEEKVNCEYWKGRFLQYYNGTGICKRGNTG